MDPQVKQLGQEILQLEHQLDDSKKELERIQKLCTHDWKEKYTPEYQKAYISPGDPPGTMGVDWRGPVHVPSKTTPMWTRTCTKCGKSETTTQTKETRTKHPTW